jgi:hypothetical protein
MGVLTHALVGGVLETDRRQRLMRALEPRGLAQPVQAREEHEVLDP